VIGNLIGEGENIRRGASPFRENLQGEPLLNTPFRGYTLYAFTF
jgi:hypothetical protein